MIVILFNIFLLGINFDKSNIKLYFFNSYCFFFFLELKIYRSIYIDLIYVRVGNPLNNETLCLFILFLYIIVFSVVLSFFCCQLF